MKIRTIGYYLREAVGSLVKNRLMSVASVLTVASCIFIVSVFYCLAANVDFMLSQLEGSIGISVFLNDEIGPDEVMALYHKIGAVPHVVKTTYVSQQEALDWFVDSLEDEYKHIANGLELDNPFPRSFEIEIEDLSYQEDVLQAIGTMSADGVEHVRHARDVADIALTVSNVIRAVCLVLILILAVISVVIIINTIRITVNARRHEINIMKYVGATDWFIRWPFVAEGLLIGLAGGLLPALLCWFGYGRVISAIHEGLPILNFVQFRPWSDIFSYLFPFALLLGIIIGTVGSLMSIRRHLKV